MNFSLSSHRGESEATSLNVCPRVTKSFSESVQLSHCSHDARSREDWALRIDSRVSLDVENAALTRVAHYTTSGTYPYGFCQGICLNCPLLDVDCRTVLVSTVRA